MRESGIYEIRNNVNGKIYIGSSQNIKDRWVNHKKALRNNYHENSYLQNAWNKYGESSFTFSILELTDIGCLIDREQYWIDYRECYSRDKGYNIQRFAGRGMAGMVHTEEAKKKMSESHKGEKHHFYGKKFSEEHVENIRKSLKGKKRGSHTEEHRKNISKAQTGEKHSQAKLTEEDVRDIRIMFRDTDITSREVSEMYDVSLGAINGVRYYKTWKHVEIEEGEYSEEVYE